MDGQNDGYRPRTAGERNSASGGSDNGVRDWQRNTWFGPAPLNTNPFDEPEDAPELKESRSENVNERLGDFWNAPGSGYQNTGTVKSRTDTNARTARGQTKKRKSALRVTVTILAVLAAAILALRFFVFSVKEIQVIGNSNISASDIIRASGIRYGANIFSLNEKSVEEHIVSDYRLQFRYMDRELPSKVILSVREREPCCWLTYCGIMYVMDKNRMVLFESENPADQPADLVEIKGLEVRSNTLVGQYINLGNELQQSIFSELFLEMKVLGCTDRIAEADISSTDSILLVTRDGFTAGLGSRENIHAKLRSLFLVQEKLKEMGNSSGTINVTNPESPIYTP